MERVLGVMAASLGLLAGCAHYPPQLSRMQARGDEVDKR